MSRLTLGSLFTGIGGFDLGAELSRIPTLWNCEINPFCRSILKKHFSNTKQYEDITKMQEAKSVSIIAGGFPCQDISLSGPGYGIKGARSGLWSEMWRICRIVKPRYILIENSPAITFRGLEYILCDLAKGGYNAEWQCISNAAFGFPHLRERIYIIAYTNGNRPQNAIQNSVKLEPIFKEFETSKNVAYATAKRIYETADCDVLRKINGFPNYVDRITSLGNAVNPIVAHYLFECIKIHSQL